MKIHDGNAFFLEIVNLGIVQCSKSKKSLINSKKKKEFGLFFDIEKISMFLIALTYLQEGDSENQLKFGNCLHLGHCITWVQRI